MRAVVFGESVADVYPDRRQVGGAPLHVAAHLAQLGWTVHFVTRVGPDEDGEATRHTLRAYGVDDSFVEVDERLPTGTVTVALQGSGHSFHIHGPAAWDALEGPERLPEHDYFVFGTLASRSEQTRATLMRLLESGEAPRVLDVNLRSPDTDAPELVQSCLKRATVFKAEERELSQVGTMLGFGATPGAVFDRFPNVTHLAVTRGARGASLHERGGAEAAIDADRIEVVDAVGAGDAFTAGLVDALGRGLGLDEILASASSCAISVLGRRGGLPEIRS